MSVPIAQLISDANSVLRAAEGFAKLHSKSLLIRADEARLLARKAAAIADGADGWAALSSSLTELKLRIERTLLWLEEGRQSAGKSPMEYLSECIQPLRDAIRECERYKDAGGM
jgi:hypothetical protein